MAFAVKICMLRGIFIAAFTISLSFIMGRLAGKTSAKKVESSIEEVIHALKHVDDVHHINQSPQNTVRKSLFSDPNL